MVLFSENCEHLAEALTRKGKGRIVEGELTADEENKNYWDAIRFSYALK